MSFHSLASLLSSEVEDDDDGRNNNRLLRDTSIARTKVGAFLAKEQRLERRLIDDTSSRRSTVSYSSRDYGSTTCTAIAPDRWRRIAPPPPSPRSSDSPMISSAHASTHDPDESPSVLNYNDDDAVAVASPSSPTSSPIIVAEEDAAASKACQGETTRRADADESTYAVPSGEEEEEDAAVPVENDGATNDDHSHRRSQLADLRITIMSTSSPPCWIVSSPVPPSPTVSSHGIPPSSSCRNTPGSPPRPSGERTSFCVVAMASPLDARAHRDRGGGVPPPPD
eukprot:CAMPEP_0181132674 /NCGR_PEP_ID=MMETSP1071-20121207/31121_1 /TAXON_ID=35127 /ORGANISM="Thalassiosira sp., Strain NH16" /LENGTH=281 /DNA_ID=CAMNT_0023219023 /DNA_START=130 /DNA_END=973 /DNA_ORIENTATION=+